MSFATPARWFVYTGIFFRWLCVILLLANIADQEYTHWVPWDVSEFTPTALFFVILPAVVLTAIEILWLFYRKKTEEGFTKRHDLNMLVTRYFLAFIFFNYGIAKIIDQQFGSQYQLLDRPLGEINGFSLSWRFFDYSYKYKLFIGLGQIIAATLFLFRKTTTLAAVILLPIISNIVFINFTFGVPVTFYSVCYLVFAVFILLCDYDRLYTLFITNKAFPVNQALETGRYSFFAKSSFRIIKTVFTIAIILWPFSDYFVYSKDRNTNNGFKGSYKVSRFVFGDNADCADSTRWEKIFVEKWSGTGVLQNSNGKTFILQ